MQQWRHWLVLSLLPACLLPFPPIDLPAFSPTSPVSTYHGASLQEVRIPAGPRLLILAHIDQYRHILRPAMPIPKQLPHE